MEKMVLFIVTLPLILLISGALSYGIVYLVFDPKSELDNEPTVWKRDPVYTFNISNINSTPIIITTTFTGTFPDDERGDLYLMDFGDGSDSGWVETPVLTHEYERVDTYTLTMFSPRNNMSRVREFFFEVDLRMIGNYSPFAVIKDIVYTYYISDQPVMLSGKGSFDIDGDVIGYYWEFGDGTHSDLSTGIRDGYQPTKVATHTYEGPGCYVVKLWVMDDQYRKSETPATTTVRILSH